MKSLIKRMAACVLAVSFFLPLTQCSQKLGSTSPPVTLSASHAYEWPGLLSTVTLFLFFWPLAVQLWRVIKRSGLPSRKASWAEVALSGLSLVGISCLVLPWSLNLGATIRYGAYLAYASVLAYGVVSLIEAIKSGSHRERHSGASPRLST